MMLNRLNKLTDRNVKGLYRGIFYIFLEAALYAASIVAFYYLLFCVFEGATKSQMVIGLAILVVLLSILRMVFTSVSYQSVMIEAYKITSGVRVKLANQLKKITFGFFLKKNLGNLSNAVLQDTNLLDFLLSHVFIRWVRDVFAVILLLGIMAFLNLQLFFISVVIFLVAFPFFLQGRKTTTKLGSKRFITVDQTDSYILEYIQGIAVMKSFGLVGDQNKKLLYQLKKLAKDSLVAEGSILAWGMLFTLIIELGLPVLFYSAMRLFSNDMQHNLALLLFIITYILMYLAMFDVMQYSMLGQHMINAMGRVEDIFKHPTLGIPQNPQKPTNFDITFSDVSFAYGSKEVLHNISFTAEERSMTALVGHSGAGKTTIANLIPLFWNTYSGTIQIGGVEIREIDNKDLMDLFSFVFQEVYLFNDTVYNNILCGEKDATRKEVFEAARRAHCHEFIEKLPNGYDTMVSEGGATLSGGQRQRISIARAILKNAPVVILDEATTALDPINESYIQDAISQLIKNKTVIIIAHRLYTIMNADNIIVLEDGNIIDSGTHSQLADKCTIYREMLAK